MINHTKKIWDQYLVWKGAVLYRPLAIPIHTSTLSQRTLQSAVSGHLQQAQFPSLRCRAPSRRGLTVAKRPFSLTHAELYEALGSASAEHTVGCVSVPPWSVCGEDELQRELTVELQKAVEVHHAGRPFGCSVSCSQSTQ